MKVTAAALAIYVLLASFPGKAEEFCGWRPRDIADPRDIRGTTLILSTSRDTFGIYNDCITIVRKEFGNSLNFALVNRFAGRRYEGGIRLHQIHQNAVKLASRKTVAVAGWGVGYI